MRQSHLFLTLGMLASWLASCGSVANRAAAREPSHEMARAGLRPIIAITPGAPTSSALALVHVGRTLVAYIADEDDRALRVIDVDDARELSVFPLPGAPLQVLTLANARIAVTLRDVSAVAILEGAGTPAWPLRSVAYLDVPPEPIALARTNDDATLVVTSGWGHALTAFALDDFARRFVVDLGSEPRGVTFSEDGARAYVAHAVGDALSIVELAHPESTPKVWRLEAETWTPGFRAMLQGPFSRRSNNAHAVVLSEEPRGRIFVPHALSHTSATPELLGEEEGQTGYGGGGAGSNDVFDVAVIDAAKATPISMRSTRKWLAVAKSFFIATSASPATVASARAVTPMAATMASYGRRPKDRVRRRCSRVDSKEARLTDGAAPPPTSPRTSRKRSRV